MRTSLNEIKRIEKFLAKELSPEENLLFEAQILTNPLLRLHVSLQKEIYALLSYYHRKKLKEEVEQLHHKIFNDPEKRDFQVSIHKLFNS
jgi:hypothetical protein